MDRDPTAPPWWLVETPYGLIKIGWRKRVINIDWESTAIRSVVTEDDVTKCETMVHAWSYHKAVEYLNQFALLASRQLGGHCLRLSSWSQRRPRWLNRSSVRT